MLKGVSAVSFLLIQLFMTSTASAMSTNTPTPDEARADAPKPNFIVIFCDDMGYSDIGCFGSEKNSTPNIDRMAKEGMRFTSFYVTSGVCSPSRASLMTGCYPKRVGLHKGAKGFFVLLPKDQKGLNPKEITIAEILKEQDYATACIGKWHLGDQSKFLPTNQGFDYYYGLPYSNDMRKNPPLPLLRNETVIEAPAIQETLTQRYTDEAVKFIEENKDNPFFLYLPHTFPHVPLYASPAFKGKSDNGLYGDVIEEIDYSTGKILETLEKAGIDDNTLVVFTSDNGATRRGSNKPLSGGKATIMEGGMRMPCVMRWPNQIPAGTACDEVTTTMDLLPTFARLAGGKEPSDRIIDGKNIIDLMQNKKRAKSPHEAFYYYFMSQLRAVRSGKWKLHLGLDPMLEKWSGDPTGKCEAALYDLEADIGEKNNVIDEHPRVARKLRKLAVKAKKDIGDYQVPGSGCRESGWVENPVPLTMDETGDNK
ncbi:MAG: sulfatase family protein [Bacteroidota bacterium]